MLAIIARTFIIYILLLLFMRLTGKRQLGQLEISEFILAALAADMASHPLESLDIPLINGIIPLICLFCFEILIVRAGLSWGRFRRILYGKPSVLIQNGSISQKEMAENRLSIPELLSGLRQQGILSPETVQLAVLETDGSLSVLKFPSEQSGSSGGSGLKRLIISDGRLLSSQLKALGRDRCWLNEKLKELGAESPSEVYILCADEEDNLYFSRREQR